jgi:hypothetical protein
MTIDGSQLTEAGYAKFAPLLADGLFGKTKIKPVIEGRRKLVQAAVQEKNWMWHNDIKIPNGVHIFGRRYNPFGQDNYPAEIKKIREMTAIRDQAIWLALKGKKMDLDAADKNTTALPKIETNYNPDVLSCLANLSNDEVFTPPHLANQILDLLPIEIWSNKDAKFLDPVSKSGVFLREIAKRLMVGLEKLYVEILPKNSLYITNH